ncbi:glycosyltransferase [Castellaniella sp. MT123]|uniref:glycosyltransferase family 2 protein n=1 Tax=Castellaniella sp. MT123 TaxID=3140381 RepID=UPI0031F42394
MNGKPVTSAPGGTAGADGLRCCIVIPCYNHGASLPAVLDRLAAFGLHCFIVDDGSELATRVRINALDRQHAWVTALHLPTNQGKGGAVLHGFQAARQAGYQHALQIDADGQHEIDDIPRLLAEARRHPDALVSGQPVYDESIPKARRYGRYLTHVWVWIETLSLQIRDAMCGFRVYPLAPVLSLVQRVPMGRYMDFDPEVMVRLYWEGVPVRFVPTRVIYPEGGLSNFDAVRDNVRISWMHTRLFFGMLWRLPQLLSRRRASHWAQREELKGLLGMRIMMRLYQTLGRGAFELALYPVVAVYWLTAGAARRASRQWLEAVCRHAAATGMALPRGLNSYRHFRRFAQAMLDKIAGWRGDLVLGRDVVLAPGTEAVLHPSMRRGTLILGAHLGDLEVCRALAEQMSGQVVTALVFTDHAQRYNQILKEFSPQATVHLLSVRELGPETALMLQQKLDAGEWVAILGDRLSAGRTRAQAQRIVYGAFMGRLAPFSAGPFVLAATLRAPVVLLFALRDGPQRVIHCESFDAPRLMPRSERPQRLQAMVDRYAQRLEHYALLSPLDWFNFYDFWQAPHQADPAKETP